MGKQASKKQSAFTLIWLLISISIALLVIDAQVHNAARFILTATNDGKPIKFVNLGEARWSGAVYQLYDPHHRERVLASADSGEPVQIETGVYDVLVKYSNGEKINQKWFYMVSIHGNRKVNAELHVDPNDVGPQKMYNTWKP